MNGLTGLMLILLALTIAPADIRPEKRQSAARTAEQEVRQVEDQRADAYVRGDPAILERVIADDCTYVHANGKVETKAEVIAGFKKKDRDYQSIERDEVLVRVFGGAGVVTGRNTIKAIYQGKEYVVQNRFVRVYAKRDGRWQLVAHQATNMPQP